MELFNEAIRLENDPVSMYNLSIIYFYEKIKENYLKKAIELLLNSYNQNFKEGAEFLCLVLVTFCEEISLEKIKEILNKFNNADDRLSYHLYHIIKTNRMEKSVSNSNYETFYEFYKTQSYMFNIEGPPTPVYDTINLKFKDDKKENIYPNQKEINSLFYEGFGIEI
ncbi:hypothetical protein M9Y10_027192 [Tritrichomonas musculus]|uniref:Uncharacterized protein n=1 Tax=Tritrichomonas musculus TaxID=1915356 RepID=A0ABR2H5T3_9EUKA